MKNWIEFKFLPQLYIDDLNLNFPSIYVNNWRYLLTNKSIWVGC